MSYISNFSTVDHTADPDFYRHFLEEANKLPGVVALKTVVLEGLRLTRGAGIGFGMWLWRQHFRGRSQGRLEWRGRWSGLQPNSDRGS